MKHLASAIVFLATISLANAQDNNELKFTLKRIISDTTTLFSTYRGIAIEMQSTEPLYRSMITIPGTYNNEITISLTRRYCIYSSTIAENTSEKKAKILIERWNLQLNQILSKEYEMTDSVNENGDGYTKQYRFARGDLSITLFYHKSPPGVSKGKKNCLVQVFIFYSLKT